MQRCRLKCLNKQDQMKIKIANSNGNSVAISERKPHKETKKKQGCQKVNSNLNPN